MRWKAEHDSDFLPLQTPTFNTTLKGRVLLDLFSEPDIFNIRWDALSQYNGIVYPALPDLYGPTMNVSCPPARLWSDDVSIRSQWLLCVP